MRVYHFIPDEYAIEAIQKCHLKVGRINDLNDPFEHAHLDADNFIVRTVSKARKKTAHKRYGVICFSKNCSSPVQWAHYADSHRGICLGFDIANEDLIEIEYVSDRGSYEEFKRILELDYDAFVKNMLSKKYVHWIYEEEVRLLVKLARADGDQDLTFQPFSRRLELCEVILGYRSRRTVKEVRELLWPRKDIKVYSAYPSASLYAMEKI